MACICYCRTGSFYLFIPFWICIIFIACMELYEERLVRQGTTRVFSLKPLVGQEGVFLVPTDLAKSLMETERTLWVWYSSKNTLFGWKSSSGLGGKILPSFFLTICRSVLLMEMLIVPKKVNQNPFCPSGCRTSLFFPFLWDPIGCICTGWLDSSWFKKLFTAKLERDFSTDPQNCKAAVEINDQSSHEILRTRLY